MCLNHDLDCPSVLYILLLVYELIPRGLNPKEETFQVILDALALTPCYPAFLITAVFLEVLICPRVPGRDFDALPSEEDTISFLRDLGHTGVINSLNDVVVDQMHQPASPMVAKGRKEIHRRREGKRVVLQLRMIVVPVKQNEERTLF
ncbi:hypothetical protein Tco_0682062 [Tanacetum coccineum]|uniref:Uncharacterized protein n=1 Tax=Tanacetum coccineum TaxID=301880 RepID=A0ABQ4XQ47_9ASTR